MLDRGEITPDFQIVFFLSGLAAGVLQIVATVLLIRLFAMRNFAVGTTFIRTEILLTALVGLAFFTEEISGLGWIAILLSVTGLILISAAKQTSWTGFWNLSAAYGLASGLAFALTSLFLRQASLSLDLNDAPVSAAITLVYMVSLQTVICLVLVLWQKPLELKILPKRTAASFFIGVTSVLGSVGWFTAMTLQSAAYVKTLGQIEFLFTLALSIFYFKERSTVVEWFGMSFVISGAILLLVI